MLYPRKYLGIFRFYICLAVLYKIICLQFFICILLSVLPFYVFVSLPSQSFMMFYYSKLWECMLQKPLVPTARISGDCNQTWAGSGTSGCAGFGIFKTLWQTRVLGNKAQLWPILSCVIRRFVCPKNPVIKIHAYLYRWWGNFLVSFWILFH